VKSASGKAHRARREHDHEQQLDTTVCPTARGLHHLHQPNPRKETDMTITKPLGTWKIADNTCDATLALERPRSISISFEWGHEPGPAEHEHLGVILPDIVRSALQSVEEYAAICQAIQVLLADGRICRTGIRDGQFVYEAVPERSEESGEWQGPQVEPRVLPES
jgi:hypothetical protein